MPVDSFYPHFGASAPNADALLWYCLQVQWQVEKKTAAKLDALDIRTLLPLEETRRITEYRNETVIRPAFGPYLFVECNEDELRKARYTPGVRRIMSDGEKPIVVPFDVMGDLLARFGAGPVRLTDECFWPKQRVEITAAGPFQNKIAVLEYALATGKWHAVTESLVGIQVECWPEEMRPVAVA